MQSGDLKKSSLCFIMRSPYPTIKAPFVFPIFYLKPLVESAVFFALGKGEECKVFYLPL
jgi:hypothetical protein